MTLIIGQESPLKVRFKTTWLTILLRLSPGQKCWRTICDRTHGNALKPRATWRRDSIPGFQNTARNDGDDAIAYQVKCRSKTSQGVALALMKKTEKKIIQASVWGLHPLIVSRLTTTHIAVTFDHLSPVRSGVGRDRQCLLNNETFLLILWRVTFFSSGLGFHTMRKLWTSGSVTCSTKAVEVSSKLLSACCALKFWSCTYTYHRFAGNCTPAIGGW